MPTDGTTESDESPYIEVTENGPYHVRGLPLSRLRRVESADGEPVGLEPTIELDTEEEYWLCRCGRSLDKPFCDGTHEKVGFQGSESAPTSKYLDRAKSYQASTVIVRDDRNICEHAGFCGNQMTSVWTMLQAVRADQSATERDVIEQIEEVIGRCPSGALTYQLGGDSANGEPVLPCSIGVIDDGPYFVTGRVAVQRSDGAPMEIRNRVTLCRCGRSANKPLCDGTHREWGFSDTAW